MPNFVFEMAPGQVLDRAEFTSHFPITSTPDVLPALTDGPLGSGAEFNDPSVDSLPLNVANLPSNSTLPPEELPPHELPPIFDAGLPPMLPPPLPPAANNHPPFITAAVDSGTVTEGPLPVMTANGTIDFGDVDLADAHVTSVTPVGSGYLGNFATVVTNDSTGDGVGQVTWLFAANNALRQSLGDGQVLVQTYTVEIADGHGGTATQSVTITIIGTNDAAVISGTASGNVTEAGGVNNGTPGVPTATGDLNSTDVDDPADSWEVISSPTASANGYGTFMIDTAGVWTYTLNNSNAAVEALNAGQTLTDSFTVATIDGTEQVVTITIHGTNDAAVISGDITGTVTEAGGVNNATPGIPTATGDLNSADVDNLPNDSWQAVAAGAATYGSYALSATGAWTYTLDNSNPTVQALNGIATLTDSFTALTADGTAQVVTITITGANDAAVISGATSGNVTEAGGVNNATPGIPTATGDLNSTDVDNLPNDSWQAVAAGAATTNGFGSYALSATGAWTYTLNNSNPTVQALNVGDPPLTDSFTALTADGTAQVVTITITGANDAAVISGATSGNVTEAGGVNNATPGIPTATGDLNSTDVDNLPNDSWQAVPAGAATANGFGSYALSAAGAWTYTLDNSNRHGAGAQRRRSSAHRQLHGADRRRHRAGGDHHHHRRQRCRRDQRHHIGQRDGSRRGQQRHAGYSDRDRRSQLHRRRQSARQLAGGSGRRRHRQWLRQLRAVSDRGVDLHARQQQCRRCRRSTAPPR